MPTNLAVVGPAPGRCPACQNRVHAGEDVCPECGFPLVAIDNVDSHVDEPSSPDLRVRVSVIERPATVVLGPSMTVRQAIQKMHANNNGSVTVVDEDGTLVGIFTELDLLRRLDLERDPSGFDLPLQRVMTHNPKALSEHANLAQVMHMMAIGGFRHVPIVDEHHRLRGVISFLDVLRYIHGLNQ